MTQDEIIEMYMQVSKELCNDTEWCWAGVGEPLQMFAKLVAAKDREALAKEKALQALHDENKRLGLYKDAYAEQEPIKITHKHEWFRTGEMKVGQMRCISCGAWGQEEITQRTWVGLTDMEKQMLINKHEGVAWEIANAVEQQIKEKNK